MTSLYPKLTAYFYLSTAVSGLTYGFSNFTGPFAVTTPAVRVAAEIVASDGSAVACSGNGLPAEILASFTAGHSDEVVRDAVVAAVQAAAGDTTLDVSIL